MVLSPKSKPHTADSKQSQKERHISKRRSKHRLQHDEENVRHFQENIHRGSPTNFSFINTLTTTL